MAVELLLERIDDLYIRENFRKIEVALRDLDPTGLIPARIVVRPTSSLNATGTAPIVVAGSVISLDHNVTNLKITSDELNTIQDIVSTASPTFAALTITATQISSNGVGSILYDDREIHRYALLAGSS